MLTHVVDLADKTAAKQYTVYPPTVSCDSVYICRQNMSQPVFFSAHLALTAGCVLFHIQTGFSSCICVCLWIRAVSKMYLKRLAAHFNQSVCKYYETQV